MYLFNKKSSLSYGMPYGGLMPKGILLVSFFLITFGSNLLNAQARVFKAGAYSSNITPPLGTPRVGLWHPIITTSIHDQLHAKALVLDDGETRLAFVIVDNVGVPREVFDAAKSLVHNKTGLAKRNMLMAATHTHMGPSAGGKGQKRKAYNYGEPLDSYQRFLARRIADGVRVAIKNLEPAEIGWGGVDVPSHVFNRRWIMKTPVINPLGEKDKAKMNPGYQNPNLLKPAGPTDPEVSFIAVRSKEGRPISVLGNYSLHYITGLPRNVISANYFAVFADHIQELLGADHQNPPFVGIMSNGTSGNINGLNFGEAAKHYPPYEKMNMVGKDVAEKVYRVYQTINFKDWVSLDARASELTLKVRRASPALLSRIKKVADRPDNAKPLFARHEKIYANRIQQMEKEWPDQVHAVLQTFKVGDLGVAAIPFEVFAEIGLEIKEKSPFTDTFTIELANGEYGYLPTPEQHELGGYETWLGTNKVEKDASRKIVKRLMKQFDELK